MKELELIQEFFAEYAQQPGERRIITQDVLAERVKHYMGVAKKELEACGPEESNDDSKFVQTVTIFGPRGAEANVPCGFKGTNEKHARMYALSETCRVAFAQAVIMRMVGTTVNTEEIAKVMELNPPRTFQQFEYFHEKMRKWMKREYKTERFAGLPLHLRHDFIVISGMGPRLEDTGATCLYRWENGKLIFEEDRMEGLQMRNEMIPRWWE